MLQAGDAVSGSGSPRTVTVELDLLSAATRAALAHDLANGVANVEEAPVWRPARLINPDEERAAVTNTWLDRYVAYCGTRTDAPSVFHEALGLIPLSAAMGRRGLVRLAQGDVIPSLYMMLIADSSQYRKSTSLDLGRDMLRAVDPALLAPNEFTPQRFVSIMAEHDGQPLVFARDEFSGFYRALNKLDFMGGLKESLCDLYDGRSFRREKMKNNADDWKFDVREPFLSVMAGTTPTALADVATMDDLHSGFLARWAFIVATGELEDDKPISELTPAIEQSRADLRDYLAKLRSCRLPVSVEASVFERFNQYVKQLKVEARAAPDRDLAGIVGTRMSWMAFRVAILFAGASLECPERNPVRVDKPHLLRAIGQVENWRHAALELLANLAPSRFERIGQRVTVIVRQHRDGISRREVMRALHLSKRTMDDLEATLIERGDIRTEQRQSASGPAHPVYLPGAGA